MTAVGTSRTSGNLAFASAVRSEADISKHASPLAHVVRPCDAPQRTAKRGPVACKGEAGEPQGCEASASDPTRTGGNRPHHPQFPATRPTLSARARGETATT